MIANIFAATALAVSSPHSTTCDLLIAVAKGERGWTRDRAPDARLWNDNGELRATCDWRAAGLASPRRDGGGPLFWFSAPRIAAGGTRASVDVNLVPAGWPMVRFKRRCELAEVGATWRLTGSCRTLANEDHPRNGASASASQGPPR